MTAPPRNPGGVAGLTFVPQEVHIRIVIVREKETIGPDATTVTPRLYHIYNNIQSTQGDAQNPNAPIAATDSRLQFISLYKYYDSKFADNYTVLYDRVHKIANEDGGDRYYRMIKRTITINQPCHWNSTDSIGDGHLYMFAFCDITSVNETAGYIPRLQMAYRLTYTDV